MIQIKNLFEAISCHRGNYADLKTPAKEIKENIDSLEKWKLLNKDQKKDFLLHEISNQLDGYDTACIAHMTACLMDDEDVQYY